MWKVQRKSDKKIAALKTIVMCGDITQGEIENEIGLMKLCIDEENILDCYECYQKDNRFFMVVEIMEYPLNSIISIFNGGLEEKAIKYILKKSLSGLNALHKRKIIHRDIKSDNILVTKEGLIKLCDFGLSA